jgi:septal ring factor EnvC (AmiA/AmiB activator)
MKINNLLCVLAVAATLGTGCVSTQKYKDMQTARDHFRAEYENLLTTGQENEELTVKLRQAEAQLVQAKNALEQQKSELNIMRNYNEQLAAQFEVAAKENAKLLSQYSADKTAYEAQVAASYEEMRRKQPLVPRTPTSKPCGPT